jgi:hypothetical protein
MEWELSSEIIALPSRQNPVATSRVPCHVSQVQVGPGLSVNGISLVLVCDFRDADALVLLQIQRHVRRSQKCVLGSLFPFDLGD